MTVLSADALLEIRGLRTWFPIRKRRPAAR